MFVGGVVVKPAVFDARGHGEELPDGDAGSRIAANLDAVAVGWVIESKLFFTGEHEDSGSGHGFCD
jgi:hypothetical protein